MGLIGADLRILYAGAEASRRGPGSPSAANGGLLSW
jgi:hypothetical protein